MEGNPIEIRDSLVDIDRRGTGRDAVRGVEQEGKEIWRPTLKIVPSTQTGSEHSDSRGEAFSWRSGEVLFPFGVGLSKGCLLSCVEG